MDVLHNSKIRFSILFILATLQITCFTIIPQPFSDYLFYLINSFYLLLGFLSIDWKQAVKNICLVTIPTIFLIALILFMIPILNGKSVHFYSILNSAFQLWALILTIGFPIFLIGFGGRFLAATMMKLRH